MLPVATIPELRLLDALVQRLNRNQMRQKVADSWTVQDILVVKGACRDACRIASRIGNVSMP